METYKRLLMYVKPYWQRMAVAMICMIGVGAMTGAAALVVKQVLDDVFINKDREMLMLIPLAVLTIFILKGVFHYVQSYLMSYVSLKAIKDIRDELYSHIQKQSLAFFHKNPTGKLMSNITYDVNLIGATVSDALSSLLKDSFTAIALMGVLFYRDWQLASIAIIVYPLALYPIIKFGKKLRKIGTKSQERMGYISAFLHETIAGARIVKAFGMEEYESRRFFEANNKFVNLLMKSCRVKASSTPIMELLGACGFAFIIWYGGLKVVESQITPGDFFSFLTALLMVYQPITKLTKVNNKIQEGLAAAVRIFKILDTEPEIKSRSEAIQISSIKKSVEFENVTFSYGDEKVIKKLNLTVNKGERIAIVGNSGGGKSTLVNLIPRFYDVTDGHIKIDNIDIRDVTVESLRSMIGIVTQETILFNDTVRSNIAYGHSESSDEMIIDAAKASFAHDFIQEMPEGYDTVIGEQGVRLSGGQRQRISIARAIMKNAPILILDEATSALDSESEALVQHALENLMEGRTSFVIAHRLSTVRSADKIIVLSKGEIVEEGTHDELLRARGKYADLWNRQFSE